MHRTAHVAKSDPLFIYIGTYSSESAARADYDALRDHLSAIAFRLYDAAVVTKDTSGKVHVHHDNFMTRHGAWGGVVVGAMVGILFPPAMIATAAIGGAVGAISGHLWRGLSRADVQQLGELIDAGQAALFLIGGTTLEAAMDKLQLTSQQHVSKQIDVSTTDIDTAIKDAEAEIS